MILREPPELAGRIAGMRAGRRQTSRPLLDKSWMQVLERDGHGAILNHQFNACKALLDCPALAGIFSLNEQSGVIWLAARLPLTDPFKPFEPRPMHFDDVTVVQEYLHGIGLANIGRAIVFWAITRAAREYSFYPEYDFDAPAEDNADGR
jgi:hypothetical protein